MTIANKSPTYWRDKVSVWLHDPVCKVFDILHHEEYAKELADTLFQSAPDKTLYQAADVIASGLARAALPGFDRDPARNGAVDFAAAPVITHPLVPGRLPFHLPQPPVEARKLVAEIQELLKTDLGLDKEYGDLHALGEGDKPLNGYFDRRATPEDWAKALYHYLFFAFPKRLRIRDVGGLGALWDLLPADSRMPDHPLWHHLGLVSALFSSINKNNLDQGEAALTVFSITPVQDFIGHARKLRDFWTGSVLLSYLAFTGIRHIMAEYGPDHVLYPSLHNQPLVNEYLKNEFHLGRYLEEQDEGLKRLEEGGAAIAAFPNKFVFLAPKGEAASFCAALEQKIDGEWRKQAGFVRDFMAGAAQAGEKFAALWKNQVDGYWTCSWATVRLASLTDRDTLKTLLPRHKWEQEAKTIAAFSRPYEWEGMARLYGASHSLAQGVLAAGKMRGGKIKNPQEGEKCPLCGEQEALHDFSEAGKTSAREYAGAVSRFWDLLRNKTNPDVGFSQTGKNERLCAVCAVKRYLPRVLLQSAHKEEILAAVFKDAEKFPSTTEMAAWNFLRGLKERIPETSKEYQELIDILHSAEMESAPSDEEDGGVRALLREGRAQGIAYTNRDKYYALLLMDGDKMGDLINGKTIAAAWNDVLHPDLAKRFKNDAFGKDSPFRKGVRLDGKRTINPALHAMISDALNNFARYGVNPAVEKGRGRLIYAGGDDVCAILPVSTVLKTADAIRRAYTLSFAKYRGEGAEAVSQGEAGFPKMGLHLGSGGEGISISAGVVIAHHKQPLREVLRSAHEVLEGKAKGAAGRNALALRLSKRSGGDRDLWYKWDEPSAFGEHGETRLEVFRLLLEAVQAGEISRSLLYRLSGKEMALTMEPFLDREGPEAKARILDLFAYDAGHAGENGKRVSGKRIRELARILAGVCLGKTRKAEKKEGKEWTLNQDGLIIAAFLAPGEAAE